jgi:Secretion system C-terminal sorting domain
MKNQIKPIITALLLGSALMTNANTLLANPTIKPYAYSVYKIDGKAVIRLAINKLKGTTMNVTLKDANGEVLYREGINKKETNYRSQFNLESLKKGTYTLELSNGELVEIKKIEI